MASVNDQEQEVWNRMTGFGYGPTPRSFVEDLAGQVDEPEHFLHYWYKFVDDIATDDVVMYIADDREVFDEDNPRYRFRITKEEINDPECDIFNNRIMPILASRHMSALEAWTKALDMYCGGIRP